MSYGYIYKITNTLNNKFYIGQKKGQFDSRYFGSGIAIKNAVRKYGKENFLISILCFCYSSKELDEKEKEYIGEKWRDDNCYNMISGGRQDKHNRRMERGFHLSEETKQKISIAHKGIKLSDEHKKNLWKNVNKQTDSRCQKGLRKHTEETKTLISNIMKEKYANGYKHPNLGNRKGQMHMFICPMCNTKFERYIYPSEKKCIRLCSKKCQISYHSQSGGLVKNKRGNWSEIVKKSWETRHALAKRAKN